MAIYYNPEEVDLSTLRENPIREVLWYYGHPQGWQPGSFVESLFNTFSKADHTNFATLKMAFPEYGHAFWLVQNNPEGILMLAEEVNRRNDS